MYDIVSKHDSLDVAQGNEVVFFMQVLRHVIEITLGVIGISISHNIVLVTIIDTVYPVIVNMVR